MWFLAPALPRPTHLSVLGKTTCQQRRLYTIDESLKRNRSWKHSDSCQEDGTKLAHVPQQIRRAARPGPHNSEHGSNSSSGPALSWRSPRKSPPETKRVGPQRLGSPGRPLQKESLHCHLPGRGRLDDRGRLLTTQNTRKNTLDVYGRGFANSLAEKLASWLEIHQGWKGQRRYLSQNAASRIGSPVVGRQFSNHSDNGRFLKTERKLKVKEHSLGRGKRAWDNFPIIIEIGLLEVHRFSDAGNSTVEGQQLVSHQVDGSEKAKLHPSAQDSRAEDSHLVLLANLKLNQDFMRHLTWAVKRSPYPSFRTFSVLKNEIWRELQKHEACLWQLQNAREELLKAPRAARLALSTFQSRNLIGNVHLACDLNWMYVSETPDSIRFSGSSKTLVKLHRFAESSTRFTRQSADYSPILAVSARHTAGHSKQSIYVAFHFQLNLLVMNALRLRRILERWLDNARKKNFYPTLAQHQRTFIESVGRIKLLSISTRYDDRCGYLNLFSQRLDLMTESGIRFRQAAAIRLWASYWRVQRGFDDAMAKIQADLDKAKTERNAARNKKQKGQPETKDKKRLKLNDERNNVDGFPGDKDAPRLRMPICLELGRLMASTTGCLDSLSVLLTTERRTR
ncbi:hypothetical protein P171DRAFT_482096 [Karstenula rhodostoma CBS 690.94]|uniref:Uncharacterized protein n=1 Tax=Karstenula rhodostoma CBS 690.94 TaxID=1392251 RepID=A0A9P4UG00_9PLEO|nr:hypothetical protein P171DRAFT_482096 [Karstenula rhodostoma CBS 690.94]